MRAQVTRNTAAAPLPGQDEMLAAAQRVAEVQLRYAQAGVGLAAAAVAGTRQFTPMRHYPARDVRDAVAGTSFYYHAHLSRRRPEQEHGHFHLFVHDRAPVAAGKPAFFHLAGLSLDARGEPLRWFTTNRWVTGESWRPAGEVLAALPHFQVHTRGRLAPMAEWLSGMVRLFAPQLAGLVAARDTALAAHVARRHRGDREAAFEDRTLDVVTECPAALAPRLAELAASQA